MLIVTSLQDSELALLTWFEKKSWGIIYIFIRYGISKSPGVTGFFCCWKKNTIDQLVGFQYTSSVEHFQYSSTVRTLLSIYSKFRTHLSK